MRFPPSKLLSMLPLFALFSAGPALADSWLAGANQAPAAGTPNPSVLYPVNAASKFAVGLTTSPSESFKAEFRSGDPRVLRLSSTSTANPNVTLLGDPAAASGFFVLNAWDAGLIFSTGALGAATGVGTERMRIASSGAVTVGGALTAGSVTASGDIRANGALYVKNWSVEVPDYVFDEKRHTPMSLPEVERFVKRHRHLPEIPSARELNDKGMDVATMNLRLLKKVEELTLYAIEQDKRMREQARKIEELSARLPR